MPAPKKMTYLEMLRAKELLQEMHAIHVFNLQPEAAATHAQGCNYCDAPPVLVEIAQSMEMSAAATA